jgi:hypothetical protein
MTVGIALTNGLEAIIITDSRASGFGRESDSIRKMGEFLNDNYFGVIFGTGDADSILGIIKNLALITEEDLDRYVLTLQSIYKNNFDKEKNQYFASIKDQINQKASLIENAEEKEHYVRKEINKIIESYEQSKRQEGFLAILAYDKQKKKIRKHTISSSYVHENYSDHIEIGSGSDGANLYLSNKLQGVEASKLKINDLLFFALNSYSSSTVNIGVGGTPIIARVSEEGCDFLSAENINTIGNVSGAYLSEYPNSHLNFNSTRKILNDIMNGNNLDFIKIAKNIGLNEQTLKNTYIPYKSWQETANRMHFNNIKK